MDVGPTLNLKSSHLKIFTLITATKTLFKIRSHSQVPVDMNLGHHSKLLQAPS